MQKGVVRQFWRVLVGVIVFCVLTQFMMCMRSITSGFRKDVAATDKQ